MMLQLGLQAGVLALTFAAAGDEPPTLERFLKIRSPGSVTLAPGGDLFAVDWPDGVNQLYRRAPGSEPGTPMEKLSSFTDGISSYTLSPDGKRLLLAAAVGGNEQTNLFSMDPATGGDVGPAGQSQGGLFPRTLAPRRVGLHLHR
jgi:hypothetical protein